jgi:tRNA G18 (ribose-2'-O)-methylase SpoU
VLQKAEKIREKTIFHQKRLKENTKGMDKKLIKEIEQYANFAKNRFRSDSSSRSSDRGRLLLLEGKILLKEVLNLNSIHINRVFYLKNKLTTEEHQQLTKSIPESQLTEINEQLMNVFSNVETSQGIIGRFKGAF